MKAKIFSFGAIILIVLLGLKLSMAGTTIKIGDRSPDFNLTDSQGVYHRLSDYQNKWLVLYFYPKDDTPGCTKEACTFRDDLHQLENLGATVVGVSVDSGKSHAQFAKKYSLPFALLSDEKGMVAKEYGALTNLGFFKIAKRYTFLIDPSGILQKSYFDIDTSKHSQQIIDDLTALTSQP